MPDVLTIKKIAARIVLLMLSACTAAVPATGGGTPELFEKAAPLLHTFVEVKAYGGAGTDAIINDVFTEMSRVNDLLNNYDPASEVSAINVAAGLRGVSISPETFDALYAAKKYARISDGAFDFTIGPLVSLWGFDRDPPGLEGPEPDSAYIEQVRDRVDYRKLHLTRTDSGATAKLQRSGMRIDVGAFGKGFVADRAVDFLQQQGITAALVAAGGTICAIGAKHDGEPWRVGIRHPRHDGFFLTVIALRDQSVSTSGDYEKFYYRTGRRRSHIIDPRTGVPVEAVQSVTVIAASGMTSDSFSTALFVLGPVDGIKLIEQHSGVEALMVTAAGKVVFSSGWPQKNIIY